MFSTTAHSQLMIRLEEKIIEQKKKSLMTMICTFDFNTQSKADFLKIIQIYYPEISQETSDKAFELFKEKKMSNPETLIYLKIVGQEESFVNYVLNQGKNINNLEL